MKIRSSLAAMLSVFTLFLGATSPAQADPHGGTFPPGIYDGQTGAPAQLKDLVQSINPGTALIVSEFHDQAPHHQNQVQTLKALSDQGLQHISVGMEFFEVPQQSQVNSYALGQMPEADFLSAIRWGGFSFDFYREQVLFPAQHGGQTLALNAPRTLTSQIAKLGIAGLSQTDMAQLPPGFILGNALYRERFESAMGGGHVPVDAINRYFEAQSTWDEFMAYTATGFLKNNPEQVLVVIVGDFHASYGGGLPDRIRARGGNVKVISQVQTQGMTPEELKAEVLPDPRHGARADWVWVSN